MNQIYDTYTQDPDETFKMYVERLMKAKPKFGGTFATPQQGQDATSKATGGLLTGLFPEYADRMGGEGGGIDYSNPFGSTSSDPFGSPYGRNNPTFATAEDVARAKKVADFFNGSGKGLSQLGGAVFGLPGMLLGGVASPLANKYYESQQDSFNQGYSLSPEGVNEALVSAGWNPAEYSETPISMTESFTNPGFYSASEGIDSWSGGLDSYSGSSIDAGDRGE
jgi:hypothetical protein